MKRFVLLFACLSAFAADDYQISGIVVDHVTNRPLNHVLVQIIKLDKDGNEASALTDGDGRFTFPHVSKGKYNLQAQKRGQFPQGFHATGEGFATAIVVNGQLKTDGLIFPLRTDSAVSGTVIGDDGEPVRNAQVYLFEEAIENGEARTSQPGTSNTNAEGRFHFGHLPAGKYYLAAAGTPWYSQPGSGQTEEAVYPITFSGNTTDAAAAQPVTLIEGATANLQIVLHLVPGIHVKLPNNQGVQLSVAGPGGTQVPVPTVVGNAAVGIIDPRGHQLLHGPVQMPSEPVNQSLELFNIAAGRYQVTSFAQNGSQAQHFQTVDLANGSVLSLDQASSASTVSGRVVFDTPRPEGEFAISLGGRRGGVAAPIATDGAFQFEKISSGTARLSFNTGSLMMTSLMAKGARVVDDQLEVPAGASVELTIHAQSSQTLTRIEGFAVRGDNGVPGAMVLLLPIDLAKTRLIRRDQSDADGSFSLPNVLPGRYTLLAIDDGHALAYKDEKVIQPYLAGGLSITIPLKNDEPLKVPIQTRQP